MTPTQTLAGPRKALLTLLATLVALIISVGPAFADDNVRATTVRLSNGEATNAAEPYLDFFLQRYADAYRIELTAFIDAVVAGTKPTPSIDDAIEALRLAEAATESAKTGKPVSLS